MDKFVELIQDKIKKSERVQGNASGPFPIGFTVGELNDAVFSITTKKDAIAFFRGYVDYLKSLPDDGKALRGRTEEKVAQHNIGWITGNGMSALAIAMWNDAVGISHPKFGTTIPTPNEAYRVGLQQACKRDAPAYREYVNDKSS